MEIKKIRRILFCRRCGEVFSDRVEEKIVKKEDKFPRLSQPLLNSGPYCFTCRESSFTILDELDPNPEFIIPYTVAA